MNQHSGNKSRSAHKGKRKARGERVKFKMRGSELHGEKLQGAVRMIYHGAHAEVANVISAIREGLPFEELNYFESVSGMSQSAIAAVVGIPARTFSRRKAEGRLQPAESERLVRLSKLFLKAQDLFEGDAGAALRWLEAPQKALGDIAPLEYAKTEVGAQAVEAVIGRLEHGAIT